MSKIITHSLFSLVFAALFFLPDLIYKIAQPEYFVFNSKLYKEFIAFFILNFILLSISSGKIRYFFYFIFISFSLSELLHYSFFHSLIMPYEVPMLFDQSEEMLDSFKGVWQYMLVPVVIYFGLMVLMYLLLRKINNYLLKGRIIPVLLIVFLLSAGSLVASKRESPYVFLPKSESTSIKNMYNVVSWSIAKELPKLWGKREKVPVFKPYQINDVNIKKPQTIVVVMGESLGSKYMSLYGFDKSTTPLLEKRADELQYTWGYSAGVNTDVAVPTFFFVKREPQNNKIFLKGETSLFALAKQAGFVTHYVTTQKLTVVGGFLGTNVDKVLSKKDFKSEKITYDEVLVNYLKDVDFSKNNFILLHQRNSHTPYAKQTPKAFYKYPFEDLPYEEHMRGSYYNSVLYTDYLLDSMINIIKKQAGSAVLFFTSDHSEMMGDKDEEGRFGHSYLGFTDAKVPMIIYTNDDAEYLDKELNLKNTISHYQFGKLIVKSLGKEIINPNENGEFYINGVDISGSQGFLSYKKLDD